MTHVYPFESSAERIWLGEHAMELTGPEDSSGHEAGAGHHRHDPHHH